MIATPRELAAGVTPWDDDTGPDECPECDAPLDTDECDECGWAVDGTIDPDGYDGPCDCPACASR